MSQRKTETEDFKRWLQERVKESKLTPSEAAQFTAWLVSCSCETKHKETSVSFKDVVELVTWFRGRMTEMFVRDDERKELSGWLADRLSSHTCITEEEMHRVCDGLLDEPDKK